MNIKKQKIVLFVLVFFLILTSCATKDSDGEYISGAARRSQKEKEFVTNVCSTTYTVQAMDRVKVKVDEEYAENRLMDLYYPPDFTFDRKLPAVIVYNGFSGIQAKNMGRHIDWAALLAAYDMIGITYEPVYKDKDFAILLNSLSSRGDELCIDSENLGLVCACGTCPEGLRKFCSDSGCAESLEAGVFLYGAMPWTDSIRRESSFLLVKTGKGLESYVKQSIDDFAVSAKGAGVDVTIINYDEGYKYFDITENPHQPWEYGINVPYTRDCDVTKEILVWLQEQLLSKPL